ncbi:SSU rRNA processing protein [Syncephalastrum racemosum]|uniref:SSU rRNA processing protein n=1 Tax=Syncephalastrum racemosum TaxID=13706 RepID=A0A1X2HI34_SYNRA|nr:SSU rRNA processing protein [Syncephalastrum racemosum]
MPKRQRTETSQIELQEFSGFKILPVMVGSSGNRHYLYIRQHVMRTPTKGLEPDRTLFVLNLPVDTTDSHLEELFRPAHGITRVLYQDILVEQQHQSTSVPSPLRRLLHSGSAAHVVFESADDLASILTMTDSHRSWKPSKKSKAELEPLGFARYLHKYDVCRPTDMWAQVEKCYTKFDTHEYERERDVKDKAEQMDDDGFTVVVRKRAPLAVEQTEAALPKKKKSELKDFYRFQFREKKQTELQDLRKKFEEDKEKIAKLKQARKFKPY